MQQNSQARDAAAFGLVRTDDAGSEELRHVEGHLSRRVREESQHTIRAARKTYPDRYLAGDEFEHQRAREVNGIIECIHS